MPIRLFDLVSGTQPATLRCRLAASVPDGPLKLSTLTEASFPGYKAGEPTITTQLQDADAGFAYLEGSSVFSSALADSVVVAAMYLTATVDSKEYLLNVWPLDPEGTGLVQPGDSVFTFSLTAWD